MRLRSSWQDVVESLDNYFQDCGYVVVKSFDLQLARHGLQDPSTCPCPHHGTAECTCQYLVYLMYTEGAMPLTLVLHGYDKQTQITMETEYDEKNRLAFRNITQHLLIPSGL